MSVELRKDSIDLGIVVKDSAAALGFYRDILGFEHVGDTPMPGALSGTMHRLMCGTSMIKLVKLDENPAVDSPRGGIAGAAGFRYFTMQVSNLAAITQQCHDAGVRVLVDNAEIGPGVSITMVADPDGNWVEFVDNAS